MIGKTIKDYALTFSINGKEYDKPSNRNLTVTDKGIFCGQHEFIRGKWRITTKSIKNSLGF